MGRIKKLELSVAEKEALEKGYRNGEKHTFRERCQMILLKSEGLSAASIGRIFNCHQKSVWFTRQSASKSTIEIGFNKFNVPDLPASSLILNFHKLF